MPSGTCVPPLSIFQVKVAVGEDAVSSITPSTANRIAVAPVCACTSNLMFGDGVVISVVARPPGVWFVNSTDGPAELASLLTMPVWVMFRVTPFRVQATSTVSRL